MTETQPNLEDLETPPLYSLGMWMMFLNPLMAINELLFGQRLPKESLADPNDPRPLVERTYVPCPHCNALHPGMFWSGRHAFGHWLGPQCPSCFKRIPAQWSLTSMLLLVVTTPLWYPLSKLLLPKFEAWEKVRTLRRRDEGAPAPVSGKTWVKSGAIWGFLMFLAFSLIYRDMWYREDGILFWVIGALAVTCALGGVLFGFMLKLFAGHRGVAK